MDDEKIIALFWERNENAIIETSSKYGNYLAAISFNILKNDKDVEECVNDTYWNAWSNIPPTKPNIFRAFLGAITRDLSLDSYKRRYAKKRLQNEFSLVLSELEDCIPSNVSVEQELEDKEIAKQISLFLKEQPTVKQQAFIRRYWYCDSIKDISERFGYSEAKVKSTLFQLRKKLKEYLQKEGVLI